MLYDPNESMFPPIGEPVRVEIIRCEETTAASGRDMMIVHATVCAGQPGGGYETKFYALSFHLGDILRSCGMDASMKHDVNPLAFRGRVCAVTFKREPYTNKDGEPRTATKIDRWIPASEAAAAHASEPDDEPPLDGYQEPGEDDGVDIDEGGTVSRRNPDDSRIPF